MPPDVFAKGMTAWNDQDDEVFDTYRLWQADLIQSFLGEKVLEVGAGNGRFAQAICSSGKKFKEYLALEPSPHFFRVLEAKSRAMQAFSARNCTVDEIVADHRGNFDSVFSIHVMEHIEDDKSFLQNSYDCLHPGGKLIVLVPAMNFLFSELDRKIGHFRRYNKRMIQDLARHLGGDLIVNRYDNAIGVLGWYWVCKVRNLDYHSSENKKSLKGYFSLFSRYLLPVISKVEKVIPPPMGLNLTAVIQKPL